MLLCVGESAGSRRRIGLMQAESEGWWQSDNGDFVCRSPWRGWGGCPPPLALFAYPFYLDPNPDKRAWGVQEPLARGGRLSFPLAPFTYPFHLNPKPDKRAWGMQEPLARVGRLPFPLALFAYNFYLNPKPDKRAWGGQEPLARVGRLSFPLALFAYPFYLWKRSPGKEGSHFDPACDLFVPSEKNMARPSRVPCMIRVAHPCPG